MRTELGRVKKDGSGRRLAVAPGAPYQIQVAFMQGANGVNESNGFLPARMYSVYSRTSSMVVMRRMVGISETQGEPGSLGTFYEAASVMSHK